MEKPRAICGAKSDGAAAHIIREFRKKRRSTAEVEQLFQRLKTEGWVLGERALTTLLSLCARTDSFALAGVITERLRSSKIRTSMETYNTLLYVACRRPSLKEAQRLWGEMEVSGALRPESYVNIMLLHKALRRPDNSVRVYKDLLEKGFPDGVPHKAVTVLIQCATVLNREASADNSTTEFVKKEALRLSPPFDATLCCALISFESVVYEGASFCAKGATIIAQAEDPKDVRIWTALMTHYTRRPERRGFEEAFRLFRTTVPMHSLDMHSIGAVLAGCARVALTVQSAVDLHSLSTTVLWLRRRAEAQHATLLASPQSARYWENLLRAYEALCDTAKVREVVGEMVRLGATITPAHHVIIDRVEGVHKKAEEARQKGGGPVLGEVDTKFVSF